jgi:hypothetical protein
MNKDRIVAIAARAEQIKSNGVEVASRVIVNFRLDRMGERVGRQ